MITFYFFSSESCGHCRTFIQKEWPELSKLLNSLEQVQVKHVVAKQDSVDFRKYRHYIGWFPSFLLEKESHVYIYNGTLGDNGKVARSPIFQPNRHREIFNWVKGKLISTPIKQTTPTPPSTVIKKKEKNKFDYLREYNFDFIK